MSKQVLNTVIAPLPPSASESQENGPSAGQIEKTIEAALYAPSPLAKKLKAMFWHRFVPGFLDDMDKITSDVVAFHVKSDKIHALWAKPGFKDWFLNKDEGRERLEYLFMMALDTAEEVLTAEGVNPAAKVNMIKVIGELANKFPSKTQAERFTDEDINRMSPEQLDLYIEKKMSGSKRDLNAIKKLETAKAV